MCCAVIDIWNQSTQKQHRRKKKQAFFSPKYIIIRLTSINFASVIRFFCNRFIEMKTSKANGNLIQSGVSFTIQNRLQWFYSDLFTFSLALSFDAFAFPLLPNRTHLWACRRRAFNTVATASFRPMWLLTKETIIPPLESIFKDKERREEKNSFLRLRIEVFHCCCKVFRYCFTIALDNRHWWRFSSFIIWNWQRDINC